jgi:sulfide:quinone oxidoreductase
MDFENPLNVLVAGGGVAGLEALLALRDLAGDRVHLTLLAPERRFTYRPMATAVPFGRGHVQQRDLADVVRTAGAELVRGELADVDVAGRAAVTTDGRRIGYDALLVAVGAGSEPAYARVRSWTPELDQDVFAGLLADLEEGYAKRVAFVVPPNVGWPLPAYELALMTAWDARDMGQDDVEVTIYTPEPEPLGIFGADAAAGLAEDLREAGVRVVAGVEVVEDPAAPARLLANGRPLDAQRVIALPRPVASGVGGLQTDELGFIRVDAHGRVVGAEHVWAAGDAVAFPIKQGGLAAQQADAAAESIAAVAGARIDPQPFQPVLHGVLLTGRGSHWVRRSLEDDAAGQAERRALWWPPTKVTGRYLAPYLHALEDGGEGNGHRPPGLLVELAVGTDRRT